MAQSGAAGGRITVGAGTNLIGIHSTDRNQDASCYIGNLDVQATEEILWELCVQAGPVVNVYLPKDRVTNQSQGYGFVEFKSEEDANYAVKILNMIKLYGKPLRVSKASQDKSSKEVGANLFIGNLDPDVDETLLYNTFNAFGVIVNNPKITRDPESGVSKGFGFISFEDFDASDAAIDAMNGQYLGGRPITVSYAYKKDTKGERHGTPAERLLAAQRKAMQPQSARPHTMFGTGPQQQQGMHHFGGADGPYAIQPGGGGGGGAIMAGGIPAGGVGWGWEQQHAYGYDAYGGGAMMPPPPPPPPPMEDVPPPPPPPPPPGGDVPPPPPPPPPPA